MSESISQLPAATQANLTDIYPATQGTIGPGTGTTRAVTLAQILSPAAQAAAASATPSILSLTRTSSTPTDLPVASVVATYTNASGTNQPQISMTKNHSVIAAAEGQALWANLDEIVYQSPTPSTTSTSYVTRYMQNLVQTPLGGGATNPPAWAAISSVVDFNNQPSSVAGRLLTHEFDLEASGVDDFAHGAGRAIIVAVGFKGRSYAGTDTVITNAIAVTQGTTGVTWKDCVSLDGQFSNSLINMSTATPIANAPAVIMGDNHSIAFDSGALMRLQWTTGTDVLDFRWNGASAMTLDPSGDVVVTGSLTMATPGLSGNQAVNFSQFAPSLSGNGYTKLPGGTVLQWGGASAGASADVAVLFPLAFPTAVFSINVTVANTADASTNRVAVSGSSTTGFAAHLGTTGLSINWIAVGH